MARYSIHCHKCRATATSYPAAGLDYQKTKLDKFDIFELPMLISRKCARCGTEKDPWEYGVSYALDDRWFERHELECEEASRHEYSVRFGWKDEAGGRIFLVDLHCNCQDESLGRKDLCKVADLPELPRISHFDS